MILKDFIVEVDCGLIAETTKSGIPNPNLKLYKELERMGVPILFIIAFIRNWISLTLVWMTGKRAYGDAASSGLWSYEYRRDF